MGSGKRRDRGHRLVRCDQSLSPGPRRWVVPSSGMVGSHSGRAALRDGGVPVTPGHRARSQESEPSLLPRHTFFPQVTIPSGCQGRRGDGTTRAYGSTPAHLSPGRRQHCRTACSHTPRLLCHVCVWPTSPVFCIPLWISPNLPLGTVWIPLRGSMPPLMSSAWSYMDLHLPECPRWPCLVPGNSSQWFWTSLL